MIPIWVFTGIGAFLLASVAGFYSITGLGALYAASFWPVVFMAMSIEYSKIAATFWLKKAYDWKVYWHTIAVVLVILSMAITSGGVFGFLSKGHLDQENPINDNELRIERIDNDINRDRRFINAEELRLQQLDEVIDTLIKFEKISGSTGARAVRDGQEQERLEIRQSMNDATTRINGSLDDRLVLARETSKVTAKLGPVKFLAELVHADTNNTVRYFTLAIVLLLDPFAIILVLATSDEYRKWRRKKEEMHPIKKIKDVADVVVDDVIEPDVDHKLTPTPDLAFVDDTSDTKDTSDTLLDRAVEKAKAKNEPTLLVAQQAVAKTQHKQVKPRNMRSMIDPFMPSESKKEDIESTDDLVAYLKDNPDEFKKLKALKDDEEDHAVKNDIQDIIEKVEKE